MSLINDGWHVHAMIAMASTMRHYRGCKLKNLLRDHRHRFIGSFTNISHIDVRRIKDHPEYVADYVLKHAKRNAAIMEEILILPKSPEDVSPRDGT